MCSACDQTAVKTKDGEARSTVKRANMQTRSKSASTKNTDVFATGTMASARQLPFPHGAYQKRHLLQKSGAPPARIHRSGIRPTTKKKREYCSHSSTLLRQKPQPCVAGRMFVGKPHNSIPRQRSSPPQNCSRPRSCPPTKSRSRCIDHRFHIQNVHLDFHPSTTPSNMFANFIHNVGASTSTDAAFLLLSSSFEWCNMCCLLGSAH